MEQIVTKANLNYKEHTCRFNVYGGTVVIDGYVAGGEQSHISLVFVPDPERRWEIGQKENHGPDPKNPFLSYAERLSMCADTDASRMKEKDAHETVTIVYYADAKDALLKALSE